MALFVINEWLWHDSSGENGKDKQRQAFELIRGLGKSEHQIIVTEGSPFDQKYWALWKSSDTIVNGLMKVFHFNIRLNPDRCLLLKPATAHVLPDELTSSIKPDDHYLVRAQLSVPESVVVTTDTPLRRVVLNAGLLAFLGKNSVAGILGYDWERFTATWKRDSDERARRVP